MAERKKILLVDDDPDILVLLEAKLKSHLDCDVVSTTHPSKVLQLTADEAPDLIVCDIDMDERPGGRVAIDLAGDDAGREVPFLFLSSLVKDHEVDEEGMVDGVWTMSKSSPMEEILARISRILET